VKILNKPECSGLDQAPHVMSPDFLQEHPVFLISAKMPGCGGSTLADRLAEAVLLHGFDVHKTGVGNLIRKALGVKTEDDFKDALSKINNPHQFDPLIYGELPEDKVCIVDGKLATAAGPRHIRGDRPIVSIDLTSDLLTSAKRISQRESGMPTGQLLSTGAPMFVSRLALLAVRAEHDGELKKMFLKDESEPGEHKRQPPVSMNINTNSMSVEEILEYFNDDPSRTEFKNYVPSWEIEALRDTLATLASLRVKLQKDTRKNDGDHFEYNFQSAMYNLDRLETIIHPAGIRDIRQQIKKSLVDCWLGLMMKTVPRFFEDKNGNITLDTVSHAWTPEYYKVAEAWPILSTILKNKRVLDPFGGAGTLINLLAARGVISNATVTDIAYRGGTPIDDNGNVYAAELNAQMTHVLFDSLPSWYKPDISRIERFQADARAIPLPDGSFDYIITDPPYGKNHSSGGIGILIGCLPEFERLTRKGSILMVPMGPEGSGKLDWPTEIAHAGFPVTPLTGDISRGDSGFPLCYIKVGHRKSR
jgi:16S rRNA G966 N2-methylase RsmD/cytidylate kinase